MTSLRARLWLESNQVKDQKDIFRELTRIHANNVNRINDCLVRRRRINKK